ncbi:DnaJ domain-containing protein [Besnoitia besnoiti]|uniref:DnaJ domain-containing protein n=1 Tax=Besnoitia besnoiti TaxID=94643 RepID=A0A2A9MDS6_BESBE|nr:DnaJ domain-containing protein [Besnoitia besnoiti]PFH33542.1 DnaJ domain-containing protein [Besnoitia besnoiti]
MPSVPASSVAAPSAPLLSPPSFASLDSPHASASGVRTYFSKSKAKSEEEARRQAAARKAFFESLNEKKKKEKKERAEEEARQKAEARRHGPLLQGKDYYQFLQVERSASQDEIKKAYIEAAKRHHPDQNPDAPAEAAERFQAVQQAYATLKKPWSRTLYDQELDGHFGGARRGSVDAGAAAQSARAGEQIWKECWEETDEQRAQRRERYRRYAAGIREDIPHQDSLNPIWVIAGTSFAVFGFAAYINTKGKMSIDAALSDEFTDRDFRGDQLVRAFFNPFSAKWERLPDGFDPPAPHTLYNFYQKQYPNIRFDRASLPPNQLTLVKIPRSQTEPARLLLDMRTGQTLWATQIRERREAAPSSSRPAVPSP